MGRRRFKNKKLTGYSKSSSAAKETKKEDKPKISFGKQLRLRFSPTAWAKLLYLRDLGSTEVGGFGLTVKNDPLYVYDFKLIEQESSVATVDFKDEDVANFTMDMVESGLEPSQFMRIWIHTHPNMSATPSSTDEETFNRAFGGCDWAVMAIVSKNEDKYCRIQLNNSPVGKVYMNIPIEVDFASYEFYGSSYEDWATEYKSKVHKATIVSHSNYYGGSWWKNNTHAWEWEDWDDTPSWRNVPGAGYVANREVSEEYELVDDVEDNEYSALDMVPDDLIDFMDANEFILFEQMSDDDKLQLLDELKKRKLKYNLED